MINRQVYLDVCVSKDLDSYTSNLVKFAHALDFEYVSSALVTERPGEMAKIVSCCNRPQSFLPFSKDVTASLRDPVLHRLKTLNVPFIYDQDVYLKDGAIDLWDHQAAFGFKTGIALALRLHGGRHFVIGVDRDQALPSDDSQLMQMMANLQLVATYAQETAVRIFSGDEEPGVQDLHLTPRELEVMRWTLEGKSSRDVGTILSVSTNTVNFHVNNVMKRLGYTSKHRAARRIHELGLI